MAGNLWIIGAALAGILLGLTLGLAWNRGSGPETRAQAEQEIAAASAQLQAEADEAKRRLQADAEMLGAAAADRILGRKAS